jgi:hypothetical protein
LSSVRADPDAARKRAQYDLRVRAADGLRLTNGTMLSAVDQFVVGVSIDATARACHDAISRLSWTIESDEQNEVVVSLTSGASGPTRITVRMLAASGSTRVTLDGVIAGSGTPIQEVQLKGQMRVLRRAIMQADPRAPAERVQLDTSERTPTGPQGLSPTRTLAMALLVALGVAVLVVYLVVVRTSGALNHSVGLQLTTKFEQVQSSLLQGTNATTGP